MWISPVMCQESHQTFYCMWCLYVCRSKAIKVKRGFQAAAQLRLSNSPVVVQAGRLAPTGPSNAPFLSAIASQSPYLSITYLLLIHLPAVFCPTSIPSHSTNGDAFTFCKSISHLSSSFLPYFLQQHLHLRPPDSHCHFIFDLCSLWQPSPDCFLVL